jgi:hypothetical protein
MKPVAAAGSDGKPLTRSYVAALVIEVIIVALLWIVGRFYS